MNIEKFIDICENDGWSVYEGDTYFEISQHSPAGEDFSFSVEKSNPVKGVQEYATGFDPDEHCELWIPTRGTRGVPKSIITLAKDAEDINDMLCCLANKLNRAEEGMDVYD